MNGTVKNGFLLQVIIDLCHETGLVVNTPVQEDYVIERIEDGSFGWAVGPVKL